MFTAIITITLLALIFGIILGYAAIKYRVEKDPIVERIDAVLPQTQCGQCGFAGCKPYAESIASGESPINLCPPGGEPGVVALADLLGVDVIPIDEDNVKEEKNLVAIVLEEQCIGCTLCIQACPVDAILGAAKHMHTVIESECTGCELCVEPCPVDCIIMEPIKPTIDNWVSELPRGIQSCS